MKIKDLSSSNKIKREGIISWTVLDTSGKKIKLEVPGCYIPGDKVCLLSPQVLFKLLGGNFFGTTEGIKISLENGLKLQATYCPQSRLPLLPLLFDNNKKKSIWTNSFAFTMAEQMHIQHYTMTQIIISCHHKRRCPLVASMIVTRKYKLDPKTHARLQVDAGQGDRKESSCQSIHFLQKHKSSYLQPNHSKMHRLSMCKSKCSFSY